MASTTPGTINPKDIDTFGDTSYQCSGRVPKREGDMKFPHQMAGKPLTYEHGGQSAELGIQTYASTLTNRGRGNFYALSPSALACLSTTPKTVPCLSEFKALTRLALSLHPSKHHQALNRCRTDHACLRRHGFCLLPLHEQTQSNQPSLFPLFQSEPQGNVSPLPRCFS